MARENSKENTTGHRIARGPETKARFVKWEIADADSSNPHTLTTQDSVTVKFTVNVTRALKAGHYGVALRNHDLQVVWAWETRPLRIDVGENQLCHTFPMLPLRPGLYTWLVALYEREDLMDMWDAVPEMLAAAENYQHPRDEWSGILNLSVGFNINNGMC